MTNLTPEQLAEWKRLAEAATKGPWAVEYQIGAPSVVADVTEAVCDWTFIAHVDTGDPKHSGKARRNAAFIAASRTAVPALIAEVERLTADNQFTLTDGQRLLRRCDIEGICSTPSLCFESEQTTARCGPCAIKASSLAGVEVSQYTTSNPQAMRLQRELNASAAEVERLTAERNACSRLASQAVNDLAMAQNRIAALEAENARLAAWQCIHLDGVTGITSDEHGHQSCAKDVEITRLKTENADQPEKRRKASHVGVPAIFKLELACQILNQAHDSFGCYLVGSALDRPDWRDVDVVMIMKDEDFDREFPNAGANWEFDQKWLLNSITISAWLTEQSGVPVDFKIQPQGHANAMHKGRRNAIGLQFPCAKDAAR